MVAASLRGDRRPDLVGPMRDKKAKRRPVAKSTSAEPAADAADQAFDKWLHGRLHGLYDDVADQPLPPDLLRMIEEDRKARGK